MSSIRGGATGAGKPKPVNVNSVYSGRNLAQGNKPLGKHGMQSVGRSLGVVRRMPPPATLPSLKAENNGQDPTINIVPQAGSGWSKGDSTEGSRPIPSVSCGTTAGPDLRPTWAKAQPVEAVAAQPATMTRELTTLAVSSQGKETTPTNAWNAGAPNFPTRTHTTSGSFDDDRQLPSRYYDCGPPKPTVTSSTYRPRFQGSSDARASQPNYYARMEGRERAESMCESIGERSEGSDKKKRQTSETFFESGDAANDGNHIPNDPGRDLAVERSRKKRINLKLVSNESKEEESCSQNGNSVPQRPPQQPEYRLLKRPERVELEEGSEEEDVQLTKLNKPAVRIMKRVAVGNENGGDSKEPELANAPELQKPLLQKILPQPEKKFENLRREERPVVQKETPKPSPEKCIDKPIDEVVLPAPPPTENVWAKRKEERESQEKEKNRIPKAMQQAIEQHFPKVGDSATVKIDKELARRPTDAEFARAAMRARRTPVSNDVRNIMRRDDDRKQQFSRDDHNYDREYGNQRYQRPVREHSDLGDYRNNYGRNQRSNDRDRYNASPPMDRHPDEFEDRSESQRLHYEREGFVHRGGRQPVPKVSIGRGRGRGRPTNVHHPAQRPHPQYQIQKRPQQKEGDTPAEVSTDTPVINLTDQELVVSTEDARADFPKIDPAQSSSEARVDQRSSASVEKIVQTGFRGRGGRGRGMRGDDRRRPSNQQFRDGVQDQKARKPRNVDGGDEGEPRLDQGRNFTNSRGTYSHQRSRRGQQRVVVQRTARPAPPSRSSEEPVSQDDSRLKSPVVSSEGHEEWETASESSNRIPRQEKAEKERSVEKVSNNGQKISAERIRSKNGQPARRTCRSPSDGNSKQAPSEKAKQPSPDKPSDGLAGLDINNIASVVVIDEHLQETVTPEASAEFEEVMNKKMRKQKALEQQMKQEAEERKRLKEKERLEKIQAKKAARLQAKKDHKKDERKKQGSSEMLNEVPAKKDEKENQKVTPPKEEVQNATISRNVNSSLKKDVPVTTVWNSAHVAAMDKQRQEENSVLPSHIPSPIARPTPKSKVSGKSKEDQHPIVELPVSLSSDNHLRGSDTYDFTFDPNIHEAQTRELQEKNNSNVSSIGVSESGSVADDLKMKEKIIKLKDLWGEGDRENTAPLPSNVAKVKPQPQGGEQSAVDVSKGDQPPGTTGGAAHQQRSPSITPFSATPFGGISFPNYLPDMASGYIPASHGGSIMPPPNAISPPTTMPGPYMQPRTGGRGAFMDSSMYNPVAAQQRQSMWAPNAAVDNVMPFGNTPPPPIMQQGNSGQYNFNNKTSMHHPPPQMQRGYPPNNMPAGQQRMGNGPPMMFGPPQMPMDMMGMNMPPPHHGNPHLGAVGSQRNDRPQPFASLMGSSFPPAQPPPHFNQPPPSVDMRFAQPPPPPFGHDMWNQNKHFAHHQPSMGGNFRGQPPMNRAGLPMQGSDVWTSTPMQTFNPHHNGHHRSGGGMQKNGPRGVGGHNQQQQQQQQQQMHHDRGDMKRPSSAGQQASNGASA